MFKKLATYILCAHIALFPIAKSYAFFPLAVVAAEAAIDVAAPIAIRYVGAEISIALMNKAMQGSNAYYSAIGKLSKLKYAKYFNKKALIGSALFLAAIDGMGYLIANNAIEKPIKVSGDIQPVKGKFWGWRNWYVSSPQKLFIKVKSNSSVLKSLARYELIKFSDNKYKINFYYSNNRQWAGSGDTLTFDDCENYSWATASTCDDDYVVPTEPVAEDEFNTVLINWMDKLPDDEKKKYFADEANKIFNDLKKDIQVDAAPTMLDGSPLPSIGAPEWKQAHWYLTNTAQSTDSSKPHYLPLENTEKADHLANTVANGNSTITALNAGEETIGTNTGDKGTTGDQSHNQGSTTVNVNTAGIESRIDETNKLLRGMGSATVEAKNIQSEIDENSLWNPNKYPNGLAGIWDDFRDGLDNTSLFEFINSFKTNYGSGVLPVWRFDFTAVGLGSADISLTIAEWNFIKIIMSVSALYYSRKIVIG